LTQNRKSIHQKVFPRKENEKRCWTAKKIKRGGRENQESKKMLVAKSKSKSKKCKQNKKTNCFYNMLNYLIMLNTSGNILSRIKNVKTFIF
jgi:hypothetical protein